ncbi:MAG TPA: response regulator, partial [Candidatus Polarisedimenticolia bacterium]|nr:response regulator [Candidatus Polarisedimenticolia bacterium]
MSRRADKPRRPPRRPARAAPAPPPPPQDDVAALRDSTRAHGARLVDALESSRASYLTVFDLSPIGYAVMDENGRLESINLMLAGMLGQLRAYMAGLPFLLSVANEHRARFLQYLHECREAGGEGKWCELHLLGSAAVGTIPVRLVTRRIKTPGGNTRLLMAAVDQSKHERTIADLEENSRRQYLLTKELEARSHEAEEASARLRGMAREVNRAEQRERQRIARLLHDDLQQLLVSAKMRMRLLQTGSGNGRGLDEVTDLIDAAINSSRLLTSQISPPLLEDAGLEAGLRWLVRFMQDHHKLAVDLEVNLGSEPMDLSDRDFLFQAARELLLNIVKHANVRSARVRASARHRRAVLEVIDQGIGFDSEVVKGDGREMGLRTLWERVRLLGGTLVVDTHPGEGSRIRLNLPLDEADASGEKKKKKKDLPTPVRQPAAAAGASERVRVLIADDHRVVREGLQSLLNREDWLEVVGQAADGREAVLMTRELEPDVVIMDISMPELNGIEATRIITGENPH